MDKRIIHIAVLFVTILLAQILIFNHILLFGIAAPLVLVYFIVRTPIDMGTNILLTLCSDTPGLNALACTLTAVVKKPVFYAYVQHDDRMKGITPNILTLGLADYCKYLFTITGIFSFLVFSIEYFSFADIKEIFILTLGSTALTFLLLLGTDSLVTIRHDRRSK